MQSNPVLGVGETVPEYSEGYDRGYRDGFACAEADGVPATRVKEWKMGSGGHLIPQHPDAPDWWELPVKFDAVATAVLSTGGAFASGYLVGYQRGYRIQSIG